MEILSKNYNCSNPIVAGFLPILFQSNDADDQVDGQQASKLNQFKNNIKSSKKNLHILITATKNQQSNTSYLNNKISQQSQLTTIYQIDVSKICTNTPQIYTPRLDSTSQSHGQHTRSKKTQRNKRQKEARRKRRNQRHVHFPKQDELIAIVILIEDDECMKEYRNKYWEFFAIDRQRFEHRVSKMVKTLECVLEPLHRERIYKERFFCDESEEEKLDSGCDSTNNDSDQGKTKFKKCTNSNVKTRRSNSCKDDGESGFEHESSESECDDKEREISVSITVQSTRFEFYTPNQIPEIGQIK